MTPPPSLFHTLLRPAILQILRATGFQGAKSAVLDCLTDLAVRYFFNLCQVTALYAAHNGSEDLAPTVVDVRMALQHAGAILPEKTEQEQEYLDDEDMRGVEVFLAWITGPLNKEIRRVALDGNEDVTDYLDALKKKHSKTDDDSKYMGTLLGRMNEHGDVMVEGGDYPSIDQWEDILKVAAQRKPDVMEVDREPSGTPSSGLSSLEDQTFDNMDL